MRSSISLFSGIAGLDEGLHRAGYDPLFCSEIDPNARETLEHWCGERNISPLINDDICAVDPHNLINDLELKPEELDLLAGGPPCQSFSLIGNRKSLEDDRGRLLLKMLEFAKVLRPQVVLIEQVKGLISARGSDGKRGSVLAQLVSDLEAIGYTVRHNVLRAADYGIPQLRDRLFIIGLLGTREFSFPDPTHRDPGKSCQNDLFGDLVSYSTVRDAIEDLPPPLLKDAHDTSFSHVDITPSRDRERIKGVPEGGFLANQLHLAAEQRMRLNPKKDTTKFRRLNWDRPALTLRGGEAFYHPTKDRYLTPREYMRLHRFSDHHLLFGPIRARSGTFNRLDQHRLVANAVPPPLAEAIGNQIAKYLAN